MTPLAIILTFVPLFLIGVEQLLLAIRVIELTNSIEEQKLLLSELIDQLSEELNLYDADI